MKIVSAAADRRPAPLARAAYARAMGGVTKRPPATFLRQDDAAALAVLRADASPGSTTGVGWSAELAQTALGAFILSLRPYSAAARIAAGSIPANLGPVSSLSYPTRVAGPAAPQWVGEGGEIPVATRAFSLVTLGPRKKLASIIPWSNELAKRSDAAALFEVLLREDAAAGLDAAMLSTDAASASAHAGLLNGLTAGAGFAGGDATAIETDLAALAATVAGSGSGEVMFIVAPARLAKLRILHPVLAASLDITASAAVPANRVIAVEPTAIVTAVGEVDFDYGPQAVLHLSDAPLPIVSAAGTAADPVRSLWQTASNALRVIVDVAWSKRRAGAVAFLDGATW